MAEGVRFIRKGGRIIPVRSDKGVDLRSKNKPRATNADIRAAGNEAMKHSRISTGTKIKRAAFYGVGGAYLGGILGGFGGAAVAVAAKLATKRSINPVKFTEFGAAAGAALLGVGMAAGANDRIVRTNQFNKALGKRLRTKGTSV